MRWAGWLLTALGAGGLVWGIVTYFDGRGDVAAQNAATSVMFAQALIVAGAILLAAGLATLSFGGCCGWCGDECGCGCPDCQGDACCGKCTCCADEGPVRPVH